MELWQDFHPAAIVFLFFYLRAPSLATGLIHVPFLDTTGRSPERNTGTYPSMVCTGALEPVYAVVPLVRHGRPN